MACFLRSGDTFSLAPSKDALLDTLPPGVYTLEETMAGWIFKRGEGFPPPPELVGDPLRRAEKILRTYQDRPNNTGVLLSGEKGSGKSLLARLVAQGGLAQGLPVILVNKTIPGAVLDGLFSALPSAVVLMDEFEKVFDRDDQEEILSLLDGMSRSKHLFVLTVNSLERLDSHLVNRPGRIFYHFSFKGLDSSFVEEYCGKHLDNQAHREEVLAISSSMVSFNFDMLKALVEESNRYGESPLTAVQDLNINPLNDEDYFEVRAYLPSGAPLPLADEDFFGAPLALNAWYAMWEDPSEDDPIHGEYVEVIGDDYNVALHASDLVAAQPREGLFTFRDPAERVTVVFRRRPRRESPEHWTRAF